MSKKTFSAKNSSHPDKYNDDSGSESNTLYGQINALGSEDKAASLSLSKTSPQAGATDLAGIEWTAKSHIQFTGTSLATPADSASVNKVYQHWADGDTAQGTSAEWNNNILSDSKSNYFEGEVVPHVFYYKASNSQPLINGKSYAFNVTYNYYQANTNAGGFQFMTSPDVDRDPRNFAGLATTDDTSFANGGGMQGNFQTVNANITGVSDVTYITRGGGTVDGQVAITFTYTGPTTQSAGAEIQYGLMIAAPGAVPNQGYGPTLGATAWSGGSLQTTVDIGGKGATSIQLMPSAIIDGEISGMKFNDMDGNGLRDSDGADNLVGTADDEVGMAGWTLFLDKDADGVLDTGERSTVTDAQGRYSFSVTPDADPTDLDNDAYLVREVQQTGWVQTTPNPAGIVITAMQPKAMGVDFGNQQLMPALNIVKDATVPGGTANVAGEVISYTITVQNTGNQALTGVTVIDPMIGDLLLVADASTADGELDVGETWTWTGTHVVTQAEIDAGGYILNLATADSNQTGPDTDDASVAVEQAPSLNIVKDASVAGGTANAAGEVVNYTIAVSNTGNQTLTGVTVADPFIGNLTLVADAASADGELDVGETWSYTASHVVTQAEIDAGSNIVNVATADSNQTGPDTDDASVPVEQAPAIAVDKAIASITGGNGNIAADAPGDLLNYTITVSNPGNMTLTDVTVTDVLTGFNAVGVTLSPGQNQTFLTSYTLTQQDLNSNGGGDGYIENTATADSAQTGPISDFEPIQLLPRPSLSLNKALVSVTGGNGNTIVDAAGDVLLYTATVVNEGNVTLTGVSVVDPSTGLNVNNLTLTPGESAVFSSSYTLTQADVDSNGDGDGYHDNTATADSDQTAALSDTESSPLLRTIGLGVEKNVTGVSGGNNNGFADQAGEVLNYSINVFNAGTVTLTNVTVFDDLTGLSQKIASLAPGANQNYLTSYTLTQADLDNNGGGDGYIDNIALADSAQTTPISDIESVPILRSIGMAFDKRIVSIDGGNGNNLADAAGDVLNYVFTVKNEGSVTLTNLTVEDDLTGMSESLASLAPGATVVYNSSYVLTQADLDSNAGGDGVLINTATANTSETPAFVDAEGVTVVYQPGIDLTKYVSVDNGVTWLDANSETGPLLSSASGIDPQFRFTVSNTGNISLGEVTLTDAVYDLNGAAAGTAYSFGSLAVGASAEFIFTGASWAEGQQSGDAAVAVTSLPSVLDIDNAYYLGV